MRAFFDCFISYTYIHIFPYTCNIYIYIIDIYIYSMIFPLEISISGWLIGGASTAPKTDLELATKFSNEQFRFEAKIKA